MNIQEHGASRKDERNTQTPQCLEEPRRKGQGKLLTLESRDFCGEGGILDYKEQEFIRPVWRQKKRHGQKCQSDTTREYKRVSLSLQESWRDEAEVRGQRARGQRPSSLCRSFSSLQGRERCRGRRHLIKKIVTDLARTLTWWVVLENTSHRPVLPFKVKN